MPDYSQNVARAVKRLAARYRSPRIRASGNPLDSLIGTILSQSTSDVNSHRAHAELRKRFPSMKSLAAAMPRQIESAIRSGGLAKQKSRRIADLLKQLPRRGGSPSLAHIKKMSNEGAIAELTAIHGVGLKTAACVLMFSLARDICPVDTHVQRIASRVPLAPDTRNADKTHHSLAPLIPKGRAGRFHLDLLRLGKDLCRARNPDCSECPLRGFCAFTSQSKKRTQST